MCFINRNNNPTNSNNTNTNVSSRYFSEKSSEKRPLNLERRSKIMCFLDSLSTTYSEHAAEPVSSPLKTQQNIRA